MSYEMDYFAFTNMTTTDPFMRYRKSLGGGLTFGVTLWLT